MSDKGITLIIQGTPISPGLAAGIIHVHRNRPQEKQKVIFRKKVDDKKHAHQLARERALKPAVTKDDVTISVLANVGYNADTEKAF